DFAVANGFIYMVGGQDIGFGLQTEFAYARILPDGSFGSFTNDTNVLGGTARVNHSLVVANGYMYIIGGYSSNANLPDSFALYGRLNADGSVGTFTTNSTWMPQARDFTGAVYVNGNIYEIGGENGGTATNTVYYASASRVQLAGSLDLIGLTAGQLASGSAGGTGGQIYAGSIFSNGDLSISGNTQLFSGLSVLGATSLTGGLNIAGTVGTVPVASVSANSSFAGLVVDNKGAGDLFTASSSGLARFTVRQNGNVGIGTTFPSEKLDVAGNASLSGNLTFYGGARTIQTMAMNSLTLGSATTGNILLGNTGFTTCTALTTVGGILTCGTADGGSNWNTVNGAIYPKLTNLDLLIGGISSSSALFRVTGNDKLAGTTSVASIAANSSFAGLVVDNKGNGDLFTASSSGLSRFTIKQNGSLQLSSVYTTCGALTTVSGLLTCSAAGGSNWNTVNGAIYPKITSQDLLIGGISSSSALFRVTGNDVFAGTKSVASISANSSFAGLVVDNKGNGDLFTASSS